MKRDKYINQNTNKRFLFPIVGVIIYFVQKDKVADPVKYLYAAGAGVVLNVVMGMLA